MYRSSKTELKVITYISSNTSKFPTQLVEFSSRRYIIVSVKFFHKSVHFYPRANLSKILSIYLSPSNFTCEICLTIPLQVLATVLKERNLKHLACFPRRKFSCVISTIPLKRIMRISKIPSKRLSKKGCRPFLNTLPPALFLSPVMHGTLIEEHF